MTAWAFTLAYNEAALIAYWVRAHLTFCERAIVYVDAETNDGTAEIARAEGAEVRTYFGSGHLDDLAFVDFAQRTYPEARGQADWVVWTDADEIVYHPRLPERLAELHAAGVTYPTIKGYSMMADTLPSGPGQIYDEVRRGFEAPAYSKVCIFDPMLDVAWAAGKHTANVSGNAQRDDGSDSLKLLHFRWLGEQYFKARNERNYARLDAVNRAREHGKELYPGYIGEYSPAWYVGRLDGARECV